MAASFPTIEPSCLDSFLASELSCIAGISARARGFAKSLFDNKGGYFLVLPGFGLDGREGRADALLGRDDLLKKEVSGCIAVLWCKS